MMRNLDFSSWQALLTTLLSLAVITLIGVGLRLLLMLKVQQRRERENRQINERLRTLFNRSIMGCWLMPTTPCRLCVRSKILRIVWAPKRAPKRAPTQNFCSVTDGEKK